MKFPTLDEVKAANPHLLSEATNKFFNTTDVTINGYVVSITNRPTLSNGRTYEQVAHYYCDPADGLRTKYIFTYIGVAAFFYNDNGERVYINLETGELA